MLKKIKIKKLLDSLLYMLEKVAAKFQVNRKSNEKNTNERQKCTAARAGAHAMLPPRAPCIAFSRP